MRRNQKFPNRSRSKLFFPRKGIQQPSTTVLRNILPSVAKQCQQRPLCFLFLLEIRVSERKRKRNRNHPPKLSPSLSTTDRLLRSMGETLKRWKRIPMVIGYTARKTILETRTCTSSSSTVPTTYDVNPIEAEDRSKRANGNGKTGEGGGRERERRRAGIPVTLVPG